MNRRKILIILLTLLTILSVQEVIAINLQIGTDSVAISESYDLADSTSLYEETTIVDEGVIQSRTAKGSNMNTISTHVDGRDYRASSMIKSLGTFSYSSHVAAMEDVSSTSQHSACSGDSETEVYGTKVDRYASQYASASGGLLQSSQDLIVGGGGGIIASQNTDALGDASLLISMASSRNNLMDVRGGFSGSGGDVEAQLFSASAGGAYSWGNANINDIDCLNDRIMQGIASSGLNMYMDGLYESGDETVGKFGFSVTNQAVATHSAMPKTTATFIGGITDQGSHPEIVYNPSGNPNSYVVSGYRKIDQTRPIQIYLKTDSSLAGEGLDPASANQALTLAANTWDYWTNPDQNNLFMSTVISDASRSTDVQDGYSVHAFKPISGTSILAYTRTYTNQYGYIVESDSCYNTNRAWTTDFSLAQSNRNYIDLQTVALHELGHACGLGDLYTLPLTDPRRKDANEIMNSYSFPHHWLGAGDIKGVQSIYEA